MTEEVLSTEAPAEVVVTPTEQVQAPESTAQTSGTEQTEVAEKPKDSAPKGDWVQRRIDQLTREKHEANRRAEEAEARAAQVAPTAATPTAATPKDIDRAVEQRLRQRDFDSACNKVFEAGKKEFPDFDSSLKTFQMLGGAPAEFLEAVTSLDNGHKVLQHLGQDPDAASHLLSLSPLKMALELARLETSLGKAPSVSKAPAPITPIGSKSAPVEPDEFKSTAEYIAWRKKNH